MVVVGTGVAGLTAALDLGRRRAVGAGDHQGRGPTRPAPSGRRAASRWCVTSATPATRSPTHIEDTLVAGAGLSDPVAVELILTEGPAAVQRLIARGALFDAGPDGLLRTREGGHSANRVIHAGGDATGAEIERALLAVRGLPSVLAGHQALDVVLDGSGRARGLSVLAPGRSRRADPQPRRGAGHRRRRSSLRGHHQPRGRHRRRAGHGAARRCRAGRRRVHAVPPDGAVDRARRPRAPAAGHRGGPRRGCRADRRRGCPDHARASTRWPTWRRETWCRWPFPGGWPVRRAASPTTSSWTRPGSPASVFARRFPTVSAACALAGVDPSTEPIPVAPAAHYHCGGVLTDLDGRTTVARPVRDRRGRPHRAARGEPAGVELAARGPGDGGAGRRRGRRRGRRSPSARPAELILTPVPGADPGGSVRAAGDDERGRRHRPGPGRAARRAVDVVDGVRIARAGDGRRPLVGGDREPGPGGVGPAGGRGRARPSPAAATSATTTPIARRPGSDRCWSVQRRRSWSTPRSADLRPAVGMGLTAADPAGDRRRRAGPGPGRIGVIDLALAEDLRDGPDVTTAATVPADQFSGPRSPRGSRACWPAGRWRWRCSSIGARFGGDVRRQRGAGRRDAGPRRTGADLVRGRRPGILTAERTALNLLTHLSGIATATRAWVDAVAGTGARIRDTRKTLPGLRALEKYAVRCGGGVNHRMSLGDAALIKDNHVAAAGSVRAAIAAVRVAASVDPAGGRGRHPRPVRRGAGGRRRTGSAGQLLDRRHGRGGAPRARRRPRPVRLEASGGLTLARASEVAATGVDFLAVGALTHSAPALDLGLDLTASVA